MKCLLITELYLPTKGGTAVWFDEAYRRLGGKDVHIVTADVSGAAEHDVGHPNTVHRVVLKRHSWLRPESLAMYARLLVKSLRVAVESRIDAVHAGRVLPEGLVGLIVARLTGNPFVVYSHGEEVTTWRTPLKRRAMVFTYRKANAVIANSEFTHDELLRVGVKAERLHVIYPGVDVQRFRPGLTTADLRTAVSTSSERGKLILSVGRLSRRKGFDQVIRALPTLVAKSGADVRYAIIGIGEDQEYLRNLAQELGISARVHLLGHVAPDDLPRWYCAADVFAMPNREIDGDTEGFGMVFIEASACGKPVVAGRAGGTAAAVVEGVTGLRVDGASADAVCDGLLTILTDDVLAAQLGANGRARAIDEFSWERVAERTRQVQALLRR